MGKQNDTLRKLKVQDIKRCFSRIEETLIAELEAKILQRKRVVKKSAAADDSDLSICGKEPFLPTTI